MSKQLDKIYENFLEGTCKKYSVPAEAESLLKEGFAKYTAMCEASTTAHASFASDFANRICKFLIPHFQKTPDRGETLTAHFTIQDCPCDAKYTLDGFTIESGRYAPASMGLGKRNKYEFVIRGGYPGWLKSSQSRKLELAKAANELAEEF
jgi:hypothetical protein